MQGIIGTQQSRCRGAPGRWLNAREVGHTCDCHRRVERAQDLLRATNLTVTETCHLIGFSSLGSFSSRFRELVRTFSSAYQGRYAESGAPKIPGCYVLMHGLSDRPPHTLPRFAEVCSTGPWEGDHPQVIDIDKWIEALIPQLDREGFRIAVFQTPEDQGTGVSPERLKRDLEDELSLFDRTRAEPSLLRDP